MFQRAGQILGALGELVTDKQTRTKASEEAGSKVSSLTKGAPGVLANSLLCHDAPVTMLTAVRPGVRKAGGGLQGRITSGWQRAQKSWEEQRLFWERQRLQSSIQVQPCSLAAAHQPQAELMTNLLTQETRDAPVDVQVGEQLWTDAPQELRSRLWMALLQHTELTMELRSEQVSG